LLDDLPWWSRISVLVAAAALALTVATAIWIGAAGLGTTDPSTGIQSRGPYAAAGAIALTFALWPLVALLAFAQESWLGGLAALILNAGEVWLLRLSVGDAMLLPLGLLACANAVYVAGWLTHPRPAAG
jgi:hypothetical protein